MPAGTLTVLKDIANMPTAIVVNAAGTHVYIGTDQGKIFDYTVATRGLTLLKQIKGNQITGLALYTTILYISTNQGLIYSCTTA
jgi:hypothetical protein